MPCPSQVSAAMEDYLETIYHLVVEEGHARPRKIAERMNVHKSTVTSTLRTLAQSGWINYEPYQAVTLTGAGRLLAEGVVGRHDALRVFLHDILGLPTDVAEKSACGMEHAVTGDTGRRLADFVDFFHFCHRDDTRWRACFQRFCSQKAEFEIPKTETRKPTDAAPRCIVDRCDTDCPIFLAGDEKTQRADIEDADQSIPQKGEES